MRCPVELDVATPRLYEKPGVLYEQLRYLALNSDKDNNPMAIYEKSVKKREKAFEFLLDLASKNGMRQAKKLQKYYNTLVRLGGYREHFKYYLIVVIDLIRKKVLSIADTLIQAGRLDQPAQVFSLSLKELDKGIENPALDLRELVKKNTRFLNKLKQVRNFPSVIDSRGKILRAPKKEARDGEIIGEPISTGKVRGRVKVLHHYDEKPVLPGEILVTRATDPGWTPLFLNAGGVILEIGGVLQHGALVAREYGKPCIAGIENVTKMFEDGQMIEMDGANGIVRQIDSK
jgi:pyruvate,water dikinase